MLDSAVDEMAADEKGLRLLVGGCWYRLSDGEARVRAYVKGSTVRRFWAGYYNAKAIDHYTGGVLASYVSAANVQEYHAYPTLYEQLVENLGQPPKAVVADRGYSVSSIFELHTRDGVASVMPWRTHWAEPKPKDHFPTYDRHGIPRCKHCEGEATFNGFQHDAGPSKQPRLWFRCARPAGSECKRMQSIQCKENWRLLLPLWQTSPAYQVLRSSHKQYETIHHRWRERYAVAGDSRADRPKRRGLGVQQLRASAALVIEWLTICHRQGWLPGGTLINDREETVIPPQRAAAHCTGIVAERHALGLNLTDAERRVEHQREVLDAYGKGSLGARTAHGPEITAVLEGELRARADAANG